MSHFDVKGMETSWSSSNWYKKYQAYPPYCAIPDEMNKRYIPLLNHTDDDVQLVHVTAIIRHGARTPWSNQLNCWDDYYSNPETSIWDCQLSTTMILPPQPDQITTTTTTTTTFLPPQFIFEKRYDAFVQQNKHHPSSSILLSNELNGTCQVGQLLYQGYEQEITNGQHLRNAYVDHNTSDDDYDDHDPRMKLFPSSSYDNTPVWESSIYYRVDDDQRTVMSGQLVLHSLFYPEIEQYVYETTQGRQYPKLKIHIADRLRDVMDPNELICPRLIDIRQQIETSGEYQNLNQSMEFMMLRQFQNDVLHVPNPSRDMDSIDCLMTTMCTDRTLPSAVNDYHRNNYTDTTSNNDDDYNVRYGSNRFQRLIDMETSLYGYMVSNNDGEYSKLGMGPLWAEIMDHMTPSFVDYTGDSNKTLLSLFSGHDTTLIPLLVSLGANVWDGTWPPYASMIIIELYEKTITNDTDNIEESKQKQNVFRLLYNGQVITNRIDNCYDELCDISILLHRIQDFATRDINCTRQNDMTGANDDASSSLSISQSIWNIKDIDTTNNKTIILIFFSGMIVGTVGTYLILVLCRLCHRCGCCIYRRQRRKYTKYHNANHDDGITRVEISDDEDDDGML